MTIVIAIFFLLAFACPAVLFLLWKRSRELALLKEQYAPIADVEAEVARKRSDWWEQSRRERAELDAEVHWARTQLGNEVTRTRSELAAQVEETKTSLSVEVAQTRSQLAAEQGQVQRLLTDERQEVAELRLERLRLEEAVFSERLNVATIVYDDSDQFSAALADVRDQQKELARLGRAATCSTSWHVGGSAKEGERMVKRTLDLMLRAFNGECDGIISRAKAGNELALRVRIEKAARAIDRLGEKQMCVIESPYIELKMMELQFVCARQLVLEKEREEQRMIREQMRDEAIAQRELDRVQKEAEAEERQFERALALAQKQLENAQSEQRAVFEERVAALQAQLSEAHAKMERAVSQAQLTKKGHVYIISNVGSFGEHVYKVGMTRRLDPQDRIDELGDASVPFRFDVHAMIHSDDAPALEKKLHDALERYRVNRVNLRKEFFRVELDWIRRIAEQHHGDFRLTLAAEAAEYRISLQQLAELERAAVA